MTPPPDPDGSVPPPPAWLDSHPLPLDEHPAARPIHRVHRSACGPVFFGPGAGAPPTYRFDSAGGAFGVLYAAPEPDAAIIETLLRTPTRRFVDARKELMPRALTILRPNRSLRLVRAHGDGLSRLGTTAAISTGAYAACQEWADALFRHPDRPDGVAFCSRHNNRELCFALFERSDYELEIETTTPLAHLATTIGALLDRHGKALSGL